MANIILIGFMACGKTTIGKRLAEIRKMDFIDTDDLIEKNQNMSIKDIFARHGEPYFRKLEKETVAALRDCQNTVIAVGGGTIMDEENFNRLKQIGPTVYLKASIEKILQNLKGDNRPLIGARIEKDKVEALLNRRKPFYEKADFSIETDGLSMIESANKISVLF